MRVLVRVGRCTPAHVCIQMTPGHAGVQVDPCRMYLVASQLQLPFLPLSQRRVTRIEQVATHLCITLSARWREAEHIDREGCVGVGWAAGGGRRRRNSKEERRSLTQTRMRERARASRAKEVENDHETAALKQRQRTTSTHQRAQTRGGERARRRRGEWESEGESTPGCSDTEPAHPPPGHHLPHRQQGRTDPPPSQYVFSSTHPPTPSRCLERPTSPWRPSNRNHHHHYRSSCTRTSARFLAFSLPTCTATRTRQRRSGRCSGTQTSCGT